MKEQTKKLIDFQSSSLIDRIQRYANDKHNGNFNKAARELCCQSLPLTYSKREDEKEEKPKEGIFDGLDFKGNSK